MGRPKGSKNKPKVVQHDGENVREVSTSNGTALNSIGISILDLTEEVKIRQVPVIKYSTDATRTKGVEKRITSLVARHKSFYLTTDILTEHSDYFVDSGGWAWAEENDKYGILIGHVKNLLPFLGGPLPVWAQRRTYTRHKIRRGIHLG